MARATASDRECTLSLCYRLVGLALNSLNVRLRFGVDVVLRVRSGNPTGIPGASLEIWLLVGSMIARASRLCAAITLPVYYCAFSSASSSSRATITTPSAVMACESREPEVAR